MSSEGPTVSAELLRRVKRIEIRTRRIVRETLAGSYHSAFRGQGMEFAEVREYRPGDDVRAIDWNVSSRSSRPEQGLFVKTFTEERELTVMIMADVSGSTAFGTGPRLKREVVAELSALLAFAAIRNRDKVGLIRFSDRVEQYLPPRSGTTHVLRVVRDILGSRSEHRGTDIDGALSFLLRVLRKPAVVFLVSDLLSDGFERAAALAARRHDLVVLEVVDRAEEELPAVGPVLLEDAETGDRRLVDTSSRRVRQHLRQQLGHRRQAARAALDRRGIERVAIDAGRPYDRPLLEFFHRRAARIRA